MPTVGISALDQALSELRERGVYISSDWAEQCIAYLRSEGTVVTGLTEISKVLYDVVLASDLRGTCVAGGGALACLQEDRGRVTTWLGMYVLQVEEVVNVGVGAERRADKVDSSSSRLLKLKLTDGNAMIVGIELSPISQLSAETPAGSKILVVDPVVRHGVLLLTTFSCRLLGGGVIADAAPPAVAVNLPLSQIATPAVSSVNNMGAEPTASSSIPANNNMMRQPVRESQHVLGGAVIATTNAGHTMSAPKQAPIALDYDLIGAEEEFLYNSGEPDEDEMEMCRDMLDRTDDNSRELSLESRTAPVINRGDTLMPSIPTSRRIRDEVSAGLATIINDPMSVTSPSHQVEAALLSPPHQPSVLMCIPPAEYRGSITMGIATEDKITPLNEVYQQCSGGDCEGQQWKISAFATGVHIFKIKGEEFLISCWMEDKDSGDTSAQATEIYVAPDVSGEFLGLSVTDYQAMTSGCSKAEAKEHKKAICLRFETFTGTFLVQSIPSSAVSVGKKSGSGASASSGNSTQSQSLQIIRRIPGD